MVKDLIDVAKVAGPDFLLDGPFLFGLEFDASSVLDPMIQEPLKPSPSKFFHFSHGRTKQERI